MRRLIFLALVLGVGVAGSSALAGSFKADQLQYPKVRAAHTRKAEAIEKLFAKQKIPYPPREIYLRVFKKEGELEVWVRGENSRGETSYKHLITFPICAISGKLGPKLSQGDKQTPEGFYFLSQFNPVSRYHLSLRINYPNPSDKISAGGRGVRGRQKSGQKLGGDIFIHGGCGTRGCIPLTDDKIEELYLIAMEAHNQGQTQIPIHIFPAKLNKQNFRLLAKQHTAAPKLLEFWQTLQRGYQYFEENRKLFDVLVTADGVYKIE